MADFMTLKKRIYEIVEVSHDGDKTSKAYDTMMLIAVVVGLMPLTIKGENPFTFPIDIITACIFVFDYFLRLFTSDYKMGIRSYKAYLFYAFTPMAIVDLLSIIPVMAIFFPVSKTIALTRLLRIVRLFKVLRYSTAMRVIGNVMRKVWRPLAAVFILVLLYVIACALIMFQVEPEIFPTFLDAIYWSGCTILTVGYGDIAPQSQAGRIIAVISSMVGMGVIALPSGIITAAYMNEITRKKSKLEI
ncbi:ion transporter [Butyrivibrio sp. MC2013]|uniref:ion transporter n=1 Tax=Butyrivibrio sp. MC2013 TaxID=1280686 RepID=UPI000400D7A0|nr:ion transporter [Butyrivibrio sp. MC2013]